MNSKSSNRDSIFKFIREHIPLEKRKYKKDIEKFFKSREKKFCNIITDCLSLTNKEFPTILYFYSLKLGERIIQPFYAKKWFAEEEPGLTSHVFSNPFTNTFHVLGEAVWKEYEIVPILICDNGTKGWGNKDGVVNIKVEKTCQSFLTIGAKNTESELIDEFNRDTSETK